MLREKTSRWRAAIGAIEQTATPTRTASRWLRGTTGWSSSAIGCDSWHDDIPAEDQNEVTVVSADDTLLQSAYAQHLTMPQLALAEA